ncbi:outer membrane lipoprotein-sorting protein [Solemya pervernicosa gill symbiont]|uniref:Outer membrane lipoprotein-sorting protein n=2 Tax=Gammaproteobacteria incertae sedis TaxID=118884 RepID=A0A1T2L4G0_9GAMM|nr:outer membrane lipoprotein-sorting protein [Candidatus Reidiella endopervernicosa]OOZ39987.1 outer membrane lipoprotein-sorting protein [Solemya pervernicosa gill symbiont]QKQ27787.1 outer membrane lipoprotein-sorting protein [Candidatus Reidiella endopervernicosa]
MKILITITAFFISFQLQAAAITADEIVRRAIEHWRDLSSYSEFEMTIHRSDWERTMRMQVWTQGLDQSLMRVVEPAKDRGNATLLIDNRMWSFAPKINRVIKIPSSMMNQSWMGSDFSNNDIVRADEIIEQYEHKIVESTEIEGHTVYTIESIPHEDAPVVWGKELLRIRDDNVMLEHTFYDQDNAVVKRMVTSDIREIGGKVIAAVERMQKEAHPDEWTEVRVLDASYGISIPPGTFTLSSLRNPRF